MGKCSPFFFSINYCFQDFAQRLVWIFEQNSAKPLDVWERGQRDASSPVHGWLSGARGPCQPHRGWLCVPRGKGLPCPPWDPYIFQTLAQEPSVVLYLPVSLTRDS